MVVYRRLIQHYLCLWQFFWEEPQWHGSRLMFLYIIFFFICTQVVDLHSILILWPSLHSKTILYFLRKYRIVLEWREDQLSWRLKHRKNILMPIPYIYEIPFQHSISNAITQFINLLFLLNLSSLLTLSTMYDIYNTPWIWIPFSKSLLHFCCTIGVFCLLFKCSVYGQDILWNMRKCKSNEIYLKREVAPKG